MSTQELLKEMQDILATLEAEGGIYKDQADRLTEITSTLQSQGFPVEHLEFVKELLH